MGLTEVRIEPARKRDALGILAVHRTVLEEGDWFVTRADEFAGTLETKEEAIRAAAESADALLLVARVKGAVVGWLSLVGTGLARHRHVTRLEVMLAPASRGQGIGRALVTHALTWAGGHPTIEKVSLVVYATNTRALTLYAALGFVEEGRRRGEYRLEDGSWRDDVLMCRWVKPSDPGV